MAAPVTVPLRHELLAYKRPLNGAWEYQMDSRELNIIVAAILAAPNAIEGSSSAALEAFEGVLKGLAKRGGVEAMWRAQNPDKSEFKASF